MKEPLDSVSDVVAWRLCLGCGVCVSVCPEKALALVDVVEDGFRPARETVRCRQCGKCLTVCPGIAIEAPPASSSAIDSLRQAWGNVLEVWEGYAADPEIRYRGSSGGVATALSLFLLEKRPVQGVFHIGCEPADPLKNRPVISRCRDDLLPRTGSRYAPAAPCSGLGMLDGAEYAFVGKPCDVVALRKWQALEDRNARTIHLAVSIFCAGTPSTQGTRKILAELGVEPEQVSDLRYRGCGWPGRTVARTHSHPDADRSMTYERSWGNILSKHTQFRCRLCPDATGELADISCGDPWYRDVQPDDPGRSLVLVRTEAGRRALHEAMKAGYLTLEQVAPDVLPQSQAALLKRRLDLWGRLAALRWLGAAVPSYQGFSLFANWWTLSVMEKLRSLAGTARRTLERKWYRRNAGRLG
ncbi:Coenzyme F420 hydrogenase/dehydrogenase, beta subunit C-terminal domain [Anaerobaca lacustris]|uniref:Coenzyme F420 hydrogenase/dehydrogenase, beta subunit C-terminal domain n=1 Tax=Anaerobaca lacustris TaxID=3044600 RepID=A0AAW6TZI6_9BACT|nr:Coenzyme F420 hydrogenase/dehydrogenase, beta subunit C-terminal domain [Sedimentisphaerales bacterium M17dextr]